MLWRGLRIIGSCIVVVAALWVLDGWVDQWWSDVLATIATSFALLVCLGAFVRDDPAEPEPAVPQDLDAGPVVRIDAVGKRRIDVIKAVARPRWAWSR